MEYRDDGKAQGLALIPSSQQDAPERASQRNAMIEMIRSEARGKVAEAAIDVRERDRKAWAAWRQDRMRVWSSGGTYQHGDAASGEHAAGISLYGAAIRRDGHDQSAARIGSHPARAAPGHRSHEPHFQGPAARA